VLGPGAIPVKGTLFDKTPDANWLGACPKICQAAIPNRRSA
jgi:hypothetical protein